MKNAQDVLFRKTIHFIMLVIVLLLVIIGILVCNGGITQAYPPHDTEDSYPSTEMGLPDESVPSTTLIPEEPMLFWEENDLILSGEIGTQVLWEPADMAAYANTPVHFTSSDPEIVTIDSTGVITTVSAGEAVICADYGTAMVQRWVIVEIPEELPAETTVTVKVIPISTADDLRKMADDLSGNYVLTNDIRISSEDEIAPIGYGGFINNNWEISQGFSGTLDGNNHSIVMEIRSYRQCSGLFSVIAPTGVVKNLNITATISGEKSDDNNALGAIAGYNAGTIQHCTVSLNGKVSGRYAMLGGIAGANAGTIAFCETYGTLSGTGNNIVIGGIVGLQYAQGIGQQNVTFLENNNQTNVCRLYGYDFAADPVAKPIAYTTQIFEDSPKQEDGQVILQHCFQQLILQGVTPQISNINASLTQDRQNWMALLRDETVKQVYTNPTYEPNSRYWTATSEVTTNDGNVFSLRVKTDWFGGGVRNINYYGKTYNLKSGKELTLADILDIPQEQVAGKAKELALNYCEESNTVIDEISLRNCLEEDIHYYLLNGELVLEFDTYVISGGAAGSIHAPTGFFYVP